ncbi:VanW family protein [Rossellomorea aquimaris]|uniref:Surface rod structure-forming protein G n=1 Tax=Rossellomorea aquimaris TaxID=189382 RepID=A0A366ES50_9BACI|nr:VanW family protein [Rossellomorea aquimaris]RBP04295.1 surface rod structure-forming protein G [Rossellomorea aquimaris]
MKKGLLVKLMTVLFLSTFFLYGFSHLGVFAYETFFVKSLNLSKHAAVASIKLGGANKEEAMKILGEKVEEWKVNQNLMLDFNGETAKVDPSLFQFHVEESIEKLVDNENTSLIVTLDEKAFDAFLANQFADYRGEDINLPSLREYILSLAGSLHKEESIQIYDYAASNESPQVLYEAVSNELEVTPTIKSFIDNYPSIPIVPNSQFSFSNFLETEGFVVESQADLSPVASLLYQITLHTNFSIIERNISKLLPDYVTLGFEAKFNPMNNQDFVITNPNSTGYELKLAIHENRIKAQLQGIPFPNSYNVRLSEKETFPPRVIKQFSPFVEKGSIDIQQEGKDGVLIRVYKQKLSSTGEILSEELINEDFYAPQHKIAVYPLQELQEPSSGTFDNVPTGENGEESSNEESNDGVKEDTPSMDEEVNENPSPEEESEGPADQDSSRSSDGEAKPKKKDIK